MSFACALSVFSLCGDGIYCCFQERVETHGYFCPHHPSNTDLSSPGLVIPRPHLHSLPTTGNGNAPNGHMRSPEGPVNESTTDPVEVVHSTSVHAEMVHSGSVHGGSSTNLAEERNSEVQLRRNRQQQNTFQRDLERTLDAYRHSGDNMGYSHMWEYTQCAMLHTAVTTIWASVTCETIHSRPMLYIALTTI